MKILLLWALRFHGVCCLLASTGMAMSTLLFIPNSGFSVNGPLITGVGLLCLGIAHLVALSVQPTDGRTGNQ